jgi:hypothetical protein
MLFSLFIRKQVNPKKESIYNPSTWEAEAGKSQIGGQPGLHSNFKASLDYIARSCLKKPTERERRKERKREGGKEERKKGRRRKETEKKRQRALSQYHCSFPH